MNTTHFELTAPPLISTSKRQILIDDAEACGSPKGLRMQFQEYDHLIENESNQKIARFATGCSAIAASIPLAPALLSAVKNCPMAWGADARETCGTASASALGALIGFSGVALTAVTLWNGSKSIQKFTKKRDHELSQRFKRNLGSNHQRAKNLMSRYGQLSRADRDFVKDRLYQIYLSNPRPVRGEPPIGQPAIEIALPPLAQPPPSQHRSETQNAEDEGRQG